MNHSIAVWCMEKGAYQASKRFFLKALASNPERDEIMCNFGILYEKTGGIKNAEDCYREALKANPESFQAHYNLGVLCWKAGRWPEVAGHFEQVLRINPGHADARRFLKFAQARAKEGGK